MRLELTVDAQDIKALVAAHVESCYGIRIKTEELVEISDGYDGPFQGFRVPISAEQLTEKKP